MGAAQDEARAKAINLYRTLAGVQGVLGLGLLACGGCGTMYTNDNSFGPPYYLGGFLVGSVELVLACGGCGTMYTNENSFGPPYYLGGFLVGSVMLLQCLISIRIFLKAPDAKKEVEIREVGCSIMGQYILAMFVFMLAFMGIVFAGIGSCDVSTYSTFDDTVTCPPERDIIRYVIIGLSIGAILVTIFNMYIVCTYGKYFGVVMTRRGRRGRMIMTLNPASVTGNSGATSMNANNIALNNAVQENQMQQLQRQNELLERQLQLQQQLNQQTPTYPPPPPPSYGSAYPPPPSFPEPTAPPPAYSSAFP